jgi:ferric-dicitrate binding protein FerR (iron transport regulator)
MTPGAGNERLVEALVEQAQQGLGFISQEHLDECWQRLQSPLAAPSARRAPASRAERRATVRTWLAGFATASALAALAIFAYRAIPPRPSPALRYLVQGIAASSGNIVTSSPGERARLLFSDESRVELGASTKLSLDSLDALGAHVVLVDGTVDVDVKHRANASWVFAAGPFRVKVKGTAFRLGFAADRGCLTLRMASGLVEVFAPSDRTIAVSAGESLELYANPPTRR